ncbi:uncharacterized protein LOC126794334 [Argentina anserina]|uniref:uncharacterized protein LOC126794334 n=1 Tax=Argentina anserina TaxID=57926 RepID=UPI0021766F7A|nr:uncharacterized protein LOC126794334 [Potentilla anserina]
MGLLSVPWAALLLWVYSVLCLEAQCDSLEVSLKFLKAPHAFSHLNSATFAFEALLGGNATTCSNCSFSCKLDDGIGSNCGTGKALYSGLQDGKHTFEVWTNGTQGVGCASYNWTVDTVPPTASVTASRSFTTATNVSVNITFSESCISGGGFECSSVNTCNLLVYGSGQVIPSSLNILEPNLKYSLVVGLSSSVQYERVTLVMDRNFCSDIAGNRFVRTENSRLFVRIDRRPVFSNLRIHIPETLLQLNGETRTVQATNNHNNLKIYLYFSEPVLNTSAQILKSINISQGLLSPDSTKNLGNRRFGFVVSNIPSIAIITVSVNSNLIITRQGTPVSPISPATFLFDSQRPAVKLSTTSSMRTREHRISILIKFMKPVFGFNSSSLALSGGHLQSFHEISRSMYAVNIEAINDSVSVNVPENVSGDVAGNKNLASNVLRVSHYSVPMISSVLSAFVTALFALTSITAGLLSISTASLQSLWTFKRASSLASHPARNLFRIACHIQIFGFSRWLAVTLPVDYYEFARRLQWSIPYFNLPWEAGENFQALSPYSSSSSYITETTQLEEESSHKVASLYGLPLTPMEYRTFFELEGENFKPEAEYLSSSYNSNRWRNFDRTMFWLVVIIGSLILVHVLLLFILKLRKKNSERQSGYGALTFPRFEIFLVILALPCIFEASAALVRGGAPSGVIVGSLLLAVTSFLLLVLFLFLSIGISFGKLLQYKEVHQEGQKYLWFQEIVRVTLGPGKRGQWTWKEKPRSVYLIIFGPLFEDLRGPPKYMLSQISEGNARKRGERIIDSDDETEDAEAPFIQKLFGILRIYYTLLECLKRVSVGIMAGLYMDRWNSKTPSVALLCITSFQLFFLVLKKPFIKKKVQLVEIISVSSEVGLFATCLVLLEKEFSASDRTKLGIFMIILFLVGYIPQMINEWYALYRQTLLLDPAESSFLTGLKLAATGCLLLFIPRNLINNLESKFQARQQAEGAARDTSFSEYRRSGSKGSTSTDKPWLKQLRELAKSSFSKEGSSGVADDPSSSNTRARWSGLWNSKRSGSSSQKSSGSDSKSKSRGLYKDLEAIFASK